MTGRKDISLDEMSLAEMLWHTNRLEEFIQHPQISFDTGCIKPGIMGLVQDETRRPGLRRVVMDTLYTARRLEGCWDFGFYAGVQSRISDAMRDALYHILCEEDGDAFRGVLRQNPPIDRSGYGTVLDWDELLAAAAYCCTGRLLKEGQAGKALLLLQCTDRGGCTYQPYNNRIACAFAAHFSELTLQGAKSLHDTLGAVARALQSGTYIRSLLNLKVGADENLWLYGGPDETPILDGALTACLRDSLNHGHFNLIESYLQEGTQRDCPWGEHLREDLKRALGARFRDLQQGNNTPKTVHFLADLSERPTLAEFVGRTLGMDVSHLACQIQKSGPEHQTEALAKLAAHEKTARLFANAIWKGLENGAPAMSTQEHPDRRFVTTVVLARLNH